MTDHGMASYDISKTEEGQNSTFGQQNYRNCLLECRGCILVDIVLEVYIINVADCSDAKKN
jgi:hypothetical protein